MSITVDVDDQDALKTRGTAELKLELYENGSTHPLDSWNQGDDSALGNVKVEKLVHEKTVRDELSSSFTDLATKGLDWWHQTFGGKPVFGVSLGLETDNLVDWAALFSVPASGDECATCGACGSTQHQRCDAGVDAYFDIGDILGVSQDGKDDWVTMWLGADASFTLGFEVPFVNGSIGSSPARVAFGLETWDTPTPEYDPVWDFGSQTGFTVDSLSANAGGNKWFAGQFGLSTDNGFESDWLGADLGNFKMNLSLDLLNVEAEASITSFEVRRSALLAAISPVGFGVSEVLLGLFEEKGAQFGTGSTPVSYVEMLTAGAQENYSQSWIRSVTNAEDVPPLLRRSARRCSATVCSSTLTGTRGCTGCMTAMPDKTWCCRPTAVRLSRHSLGVGSSWAQAPIEGEQTLLWFT